MPESWEEWVRSHAPGGAATPGMTSPPQYNNPEAQDRANIGYILNPQFDTSETEMRAAEQNAGQGVSGSGFGSGTTARLLESEKLARFKLGHEMLEPYQERAATASNLATANAARLNEIAAQGAQAMQQLQLSEAGQTARLNSEQAARLQQIALSGQQAMAELQLRESGENARLGRQIGAQENIARLNLGGSILQTLINASRGGGSGGGDGRPSAGSGVNVIGSGYVGAFRPGIESPAGYSGGVPFYETPARNPTAPSQGGGPINIGYIPNNFGSSIDRILKRYGIG